MQEWAWDRALVLAERGSLKSSHPKDFMDVFKACVVRFRDPAGGFHHPGCQESTRGISDALVIAAEIEALAAARALSAVWHEKWCACAPCAVRRVCQVRKKEGR